MEKKWQKKRKKEKIWDLRIGDWEFGVGDCIFQKYNEFLTKKIKKIELIA
jgi:hypothetical protein